jgi:hypothetical protein
MGSPVEGWNWTAIAAVGTWAAVVVALVIALCGDWLRAWLYPPKLEVALVDPKGEPTKMKRKWTDASGQQQQRMADARYYYVVARNRRRYAPAHGVQVMLMSIEIEGPHSKPQVNAVGPLPLTWKLPELYPLARTVGDEAIANLFYVIENKPLEFVTPVVPYNFAHQYPAPCKLWATVQARGIEGDSEPLRIEIAWNGQWHPGDTEMARNLPVSSSISSTATTTTTTTTMPIATTP